MFRHARVFATLALLMTINVLSPAQTPVAPEPQGNLASPDGRIAFRLATMQGDQASTTGGQLAYTVAFQGKPVIEPSALALHLEGAPPFGANMKILSIHGSEHQDDYTLVGGKASRVRSDYRELTVTTEELAPPNRKLIIQARAYNDAVAFRYRVPVQPNLTEIRLTSETTEFRLAKDALSWSQLLPNFRSMYESEYVKLPVSALSNQGGVASVELVGLPILLELPGIAWLAITEADLEGNAGMYLINPSRSWLGHWLVSVLSPRVEGGDVRVISNLPYKSAWRVLMLGETPGALVDSHALTSLNPPSGIADTSWIKPGKASWNWWSGSLNGAGEPEFSTENMKHYVDFAAASGLEYMLVDAGWSPRFDITRMNGRVDVPALVQYANSKNVKIWIWLHYTPTARQMDEAFPIFEKWGVVGLKIDFVERDDQEGIDFYYRSARKAAEHKLMVDYHGSSKPWGMERTWPNVLGYEAVLGMEQSKAGARDNPEMHVTIPFTRMLTGPTDYTAGGFRNVTREEFVPQMIRPMVVGTRAHELAKYVVYFAPIQMVSDNPEAYANAPEFKFISEVPAAWDESRTIEGRPGECVVIARRKGADWFLGAMTNDDAWELDITLDFLPEGSFSAEFYADAPDSGHNPKQIEISSRNVQKGERLKLLLAPAGGLAARFRPASQ